MRAEPSQFTRPMTKALVLSNTDGSSSQPSTDSIFRTWRKKSVSKHEKAIFMNDSLRNELALVPF